MPNVWENFSNVCKFYNCKFWSSIIQLIRSVRIDLKINVCSTSLQHKLKDCRSHSTAIYKKFIREQESARNLSGNKNQLVSVQVLPILSSNCLALSCIRWWPLYRRRAPAQLARWSLARRKASAQLASIGHHGLRPPLDLLLELLRIQLFQWLSLHLDTLEALSSARALPGPWTTFFWWHGIKLNSTVFFSEATGWWIKFYIAGELRRWRTLERTKFSARILLGCFLQLTDFGLQVMP